MGGFGHAMHESHGFNFEERKNCFEQMIMSHGGVFMPWVWFATCHADQAGGPILFGSPVSNIVRCILLWKCSYTLSKWI